MTFDDDELIPISALQHLLFCERQFALIHLERLWGENRLTAEGQLLHKKAHSALPETRDGVRITRSLPLVHRELGLVGTADVVEWIPPPDVEPASKSSRITLSEAFRLAEASTRARWTIVPVEFKRGRPKANACDRVQLCAQALCLEEMLAVDIKGGALYYGQTRHRTEVLFDEDLRHTTRQAAQRVHELIRTQRTPPPVNDSRCKNCSLIEHCLPHAVRPGRSAANWLEKSLDDPSG